MENKTDMTKIDAAINAAKARKGRRSGEATESTNESTASTEAKATAPKRARLSDEEKATRQAAKDAERAAKKAERQAAREAKRAEKLANKPAAHLAKVAKAASKLPELNADAQVVFNDITTNYSRDQVNAIARHLEHFNREQATKRALEQKLEAGARVRIVGGDSRFIGKEGTVFKAQRIRCYVTVEGVKKPIYCFTSEVEVLAEESAVKTA